MTKHTKGPWTIHAEKGRFSISEDGDRDRPGYGFIAATGGASIIDGLNAQLIKSAPETAAERDRLREINADLLEALKDLADWAATELEGGDVSPLYLEKLNRAARAIVKAEGADK